MTIRTTRLFLTLLALLALTGCKLVIISTPGGAITSLSNEFDCSDTQVCTREITDPNFSDTLTAVPAQGYEFVRWQKSDGFQCGDSTVPSCTIKLNGGPLDILAVSSYNSIFAMAVFRKVEEEI